MSENPIDLYLDLMKKVLSFSLWEEPGIPLNLYSYKQPFIKKLLLNTLSRALKKANLQALKIKKIDSEKRNEGMIWPSQAHTMIGRKRLDNIQFCVENVIKDNIRGDLIETGVWRGGACIFMRAILKAYGIKDRRVFVADSFEGLPKPDKLKYPSDRDDVHYRQIPLVATIQEVEDNFRKYGLLDEQVVFLKGWFKDTLPAIQCENISVMRLDGDMYQSTIEALTNLYPKLQAGGFCIIDDYALAGCKQAVDDFRHSNNINEDIQQIDWTGIYWRKTKQL
jgi:O-methyltransferase